MGSIPSDALPTAHSSVAYSTPQAAIPEAQELLAQPIDRGLETLILDLIETILVYKLPTFTRKEIQTMLGLTDHDPPLLRLKKTIFQINRLRMGRMFGGGYVFLTKSMGCQC